MRCFTIFFMLMALFLQSQASLAANWSVSYLNDLPLTTAGTGVTVTEMSGVAYLGASPVPGKHRFMAVEETAGELAIFDVAFSTTGTLLSAEAVSAVTINTTLDYEGIVTNGGSVFLSEENGPGVHEIDLATGNTLQSITIPDVFTTEGNLRGNRGFESLTRSADGTSFWTANEEALTVDGPASTTTAATTVRLLQLDINGNAISAGSQYAYEVEPVHSTGISPFRGLSELLALPDGTLIALERSFAALASPTLFNAIYEIDFAGATDVSVGTLADGLDGETFTPVGKELLWSGPAGGVNGQNFEGLALLGPRLSNGNWIMLGTVDNGDPFSSNTIVSLELSPTTPIPLDDPTADFDEDGDVDGADFLAWQRGFGVTSLAALEHGDGNHDGSVSAADLALWQGAFGAAATSAAASAVPEPGTLMMLGVATMLVGVRRGRRR